MFGRIYRPEYSQFGIMANILDQFEETVIKFSIPNPQQTALSELDDDSPIFNRRRKEFYPSDNILHLCACGDTILIAMVNNVVHRINTRQPDVPVEIDISKYSSSLKINGLFLSPNGNHALITLTTKLVEFQAEVLYLSRNSIKLKPLSKFKGQEVTCVAWNTWHQSGNTSGPILVGTSRGLLIETELGGDSDGLFTTSVAEYKQVFDIGKGTACPITGLSIYRIKDHYHVIATTATKIYHYHAVIANPDEKSLFQQLFKRYLSEPEQYESNKMSTRNSKLDVYFSPKDNIPLYFGWLTQDGLYFGKVAQDDEALLSNAQLIQYTEGFPKDFLLTSFHTLLVYKTNVTAISLRSRTVVFQDFFSNSADDTYGYPKHITREPTRGTIFIYTDRAVFSYKVLRENRNVWKEFVEKGEFDNAREFCNDNQVHLDMITTRQADVLFEEKDYELSAFYYSQSASISFEEIALKFVRAQQISPMMEFLRLRLDGLQKEDSMQRTMLVVWLIELYLSQLEKPERNDLNHNKVQNDLDQLLALPSVKDCISKNKGTIYDLMASHGDTANFIKLCLTHFDYERVIRQYILKGDYKEAFEVLKKSLTSRKDLIYTFAPSLVSNIPNQFVSLLMQLAPKLSAPKLLPALALTYEVPDAAKDAAQYLQHCVDNLGYTDQSLHNLLLAIYVKHQPDRLRLYLAKEGQDASAVHYDIHFALRLCQEKGLTEACVQLSTLLGLWSAAVDLALTVNVELAVQTANLHRSDPDLLKALWLKIAEHVVKKKHDIKSAMAFLKKCPLLKIEDILPFFPDFVTIDDFKEAICNSLQEYNQHIQDLKDEMNETSKSADMIVKEMSGFKNKHVVVTWSDTCAACELQLLLRSFYIFPCSHHYHIDCLKDIMLPIISPSTRQRLRELQRQLTSVAADDVSTASSATTARDLVQAGIDNILASECPLCGDSIIESIDKPFVADDEFEQVLREWQ